jgi:cytochrome c5
MKHVLHLLVVVAALASSAVLAQSGGAPAPDIGAGKKRAAACFACHNVDGISKIPGTPHLAGQERAYLEGALRAYRDGLTRQNAVMNAMAKPLSDRDITNIAAYFSLQVRMKDGQTAAQALELTERIRPPGYVAVATSSTPAPAAATRSGAAAIAPTAKITPRSGDAVYQTSCAACHAAGVAGAPKLADKSAWKPRIAQGVPTLQKHALQGLNAMPAKGTCVACSDEEIKAAVDYMVAQGR